MEQILRIAQIVVPILTAVVLGGVLVLDRKLLKELDFGLLATFVCFFIVSGNLGRVEAVRSFLQNLLGQYCRTCREIIYSSHFHFLLLNQ